MVPSLAVPDVSDTLINGTGNGLTTIVPVVIAVQPLALLTVTVYVPAVPVLTVAVVAPVLHTYPVPPPAVMVAIAP